MNSYFEAPPVVQIFPGLGRIILDKETFTRFVITGFYCDHIYGNNPSFNHVYAISMYDYEDIRCFYLGDIYMTNQYI